MIKQPNRRARRILARFRKSQDGVAGVEFALVAAPFLFLLMGIFETGLMLFSEHVIENGVAEAARQIRTGQAQSGSPAMTQTQFKALVCGNLAAFLDCTNRLFVDVRSFTSFAAVAIPSAVDGNGELTTSITQNASYSPGTAMQVVVVRVYYDWKLFTPGISLLSNLANGRRLLTAGAAFRNEPFS